MVLLNSNTWELISFIFVGLTFWLAKMWLVGDFILVYWLPRLRKTSLMISYKLLIYLWLVFDILLTLAQFFIYDEFNKWASPSTGPLIISFIYLVGTIVWFYIFNVMYRIRTSFWIATVLFAISLAITVWFIILQTLAGVLSIIVTVWNLYFWYWSWELCRQNTVAGNTNILGQGQVVVSPDPNAVPCNEAFVRAGRQSFVRFKPTSKFGQMPVVLGRNSDVVNRQQVFVPQNQFQGNFVTGQPTQFQGQFVGQQLSHQSQTAPSHHQNDNDNDNNNIQF